MKFQKRKLDPKGPQKIKLLRAHMFLQKYRNINTHMCAAPFSTRLGKLIHWFPQGCHCSETLSAVESLLATLQMACTLEGSLDDCMDEEYLVHQCNPVSNETAGALQVKHATICARNHHREGLWVDAANIKLLSPQEYCQEVGGVLGTLKMVLVITIAHID